MSYLGKLFADVLVFRDACLAISDMRFRWFFLLLVVVGMQAQELKLFAPAVRFTGILWWGPSSGGLMTWTPGTEQGVFPSSLGEIKEARIDRSQEIVWRGGSYQIESIERTAAGAFEIRFEKATLIMRRTLDGFFTVDVCPAGSQVPNSRFRTTVKSTAHDDLIDQR